MRKLLIAFACLCLCLAYQQKAYAVTVIGGMSVSTAVESPIHAGEEASLLIFFGYDGSVSSPFQGGFVKINSGDGQTKLFEFSDRVAGGVDRGTWLADFAYANPGTYQPTVNFSFLLWVSQVICTGTGCIRFEAPFSFSGSGDFEQVVVVKETPLPTALPLFASALIGGGVIAWRKKRKQKAEAIAA
ncbi:hypothetical protein [Pseudorhodoplanes sp.]|uniref:hypothetical protein n=1 Tax=Pseudorhodoplanes sp. TaxID=1934341 RepID=UPI003918A7C4